MDFSGKPQGTRRATAIGAVVVFHILLLYALVSGLARKAIEVLPAPFETQILDEQRAEEEPPPPPPPPQLDIPPPPFIPPPEINIATPPPSSANTITTQSVVATPAAPPPAPKAAPVSRPPVVKANACRQPEYPPVSERLGETGSVVLQLLVGVDGKVTDSKVESSSGYERLDKAAQAALSRCKFEPGTVDGVPSPAWAQLKYTFRPAR